MNCQDLPGWWGLVNPSLTQGWLPAQSCAGNDSFCEFLSTEVLSNPKPAFHRCPHRPLALTFFLPPLPPCSLSLMCIRQNRLCSSAFWFVVVWCSPSAAKRSSLNKEWGLHLPVGSKQIFRLLQNMSWLLQWQNVTWKTWKLLPTLPLVRAS